MSAREGAAAVAWGRANSEHAPDGDSWFRRCKEFVRDCFAIPSDGTPTAGAAWDRAKFKHPESDPTKIPPYVAVFWEQPSVADHVAISDRDGWCLSTDFERTGKVDRVKIDDITRGWGGTLLGWTEDIDGVRFFNAPPPPPVDNRVQKARHHAHVSVALLDDAIETGRGEDVKAMRREIRHALRHGPKK